MFNFWGKSQEKIGDSRIGRIIQVEEALARVTYKPGWSWAVEYDIRVRKIKLTFQHLVRNVKDQRRHTYIISTSWLESGYFFSSGDLNFVLFLDHVKTMLDRFERHEIHEWFKFDGKCVTDPHPENK